MKRLLTLLVLVVVSPIGGREGLAADSQVGGRVSPDGKEEIGLDLPGTEHMKNVGGKDGAGLCVFTSIEIAGHWQNVEALRGFQKKMQQEAGGGWPEKVDAMLKKYAPGVAYVQYSGTDTSFLKTALKTGRMVGVTYGYSPRYGGKIAHMVDLVHLSDTWACVLDNNFPGEDKYEWMGPAEFLRRWQLGGGGWAVVLLAPPPPPIPVNALPDHYAGGWGPGGCGPVGLPSLPLPTVTASYEWRTTAQHPGHLLLYHGATQVGEYNRQKREYYAWRNGQWSEACEPPTPLPDAAKKDCSCCSACVCGEDCPCKKTAIPCDEHCRCVLPQKTTIQNFGVDRSRFLELDRGETYYSLNGRRVTATDAHRAIITGGTLTDDGSKLRLTIVGSEAECKAVLTDLESSPALAPWKDRFLVQAYRPDNWAVQGVGLPARGHPSIIVQGAPTGRGRGVVLHHQDSYEGADDLAEALRKTDPSYDAARDPDLRKKPAPAPDPQPQLSDSKTMMPYCCLGGLGAIALAILVRRKP